MSYINTFKKPITESVDITEDSNIYGITEKYYIEVSVRDAKKAFDIIRDNPLLSTSIRNAKLIRYGSNIYATDDDEIINELNDSLLTGNIEISNSEGLDEISTTAGAPGYQTPYAFGDADNEYIEILGYKKVKPVKKNVKESAFVQMSKELHLNEISYNTYKRDPIASPKQKINQSINFINKGLKEIEKVVNHNVRLKQEMGIDNNIYWKSSRENLIKISERLVRVSNQLKELGL